LEKTVWKACLGKTEGPAFLGPGTECGEGKLLEGMGMVMALKNLNKYS